MVEQEPVGEGGGEWTLAELALRLKFKGWRRSMEPPEAGQEESEESCSSCWRSN